MHPRQAPFPRWGYLDKFDVNEYMARALLVVLTASSASLVAYSLWGSRLPELSTRRFVRETTVSIGPTAFSIVPAARSRTHPTRAPHVRPVSPGSKVVPVPDAEVDPGVGDSPGERSGEAGPGEGGDSGGGESAGRVDGALQEGGGSVYPRFD